jgi:hypothetical protein
VAGEALEAPFGEPSLFWQELARKHSEELALHGPQLTKRRQAFRYFTWRWRWAALRKSHQLRFLLTHSSPRTIARCGLTPSRLAGPTWHAVPWTMRERWLYVRTVRLLWEYARRHDRLGVLSRAGPELGDPMPVRW